MLRAFSHAPLYAGFVPESLKEVDAEIRRRQAAAIAAAAEHPQPSGFTAPAIAIAAAESPEQLLDHSAVASMDNWRASSLHGIPAEHAPELSAAVSSAAAQADVSELQSHSQPASAPYLAAVEPGTLAGSLAQPQPANAFQTAANGRLSPESLPPCIPAINELPSWELQARPLHGQHRLPHPLSAAQSSAMQSATLLTDSSLAQQPQLYGGHLRSGRITQPSSSQPQTGRPTERGQHSSLRPTDNAARIAVSEASQQSISGSDAPIGSHMSHAKAVVKWEDDVAVTGSEEQLQPEQGLGQQPSRRCAPDCLAMTQISFQMHLGRLHCLQQPPCIDAALQHSARYIAGWSTVTQWSIYQQGHP